MASFKKFKIGLISSMKNDGTGLSKLSNFIFKNHSNDRRTRFNHQNSQRRRITYSGPRLVKLFQNYEIPKIGKLRVSLESQSTIGASQSRGERPYQEDRMTIGSLELKNSGLYKSLSGLPLSDQVGSLGSPEDSFQALLVGVIDGHGGSEAADFVADYLPTLVEDCDPSQIPKVIRAYRALGGYFRRFRGGYLEGLGELVYSQKTPVMGLAERLYLSFMIADQHLIQSNPNSGAVATVALICPLSTVEDHNQLPWFSSPLISLTIGHVGDTMALLCNSRSGKAIRLTQDHHPDSRVESERLRRMGSGLITDSFGESRWGGTLANTRGLGDSNFKKIGVTGEPDIIKKILKGEDWAFLVLVTDGVSGVISNQEIIDLCRNRSSPKDAAQSIVKFAEQLGSRDNMTALVVPLMSWGKIGGIDSTADRRDYRLRHSSDQSNRQRRM